jgi:hypothetical protein
LWRLVVASQVHLQAKRHLWQGQYLVSTDFDQACRAPFVVGDRPFVGLAVVSGLVLIPLGARFQGLLKA